MRIRGVARADKRTKDLVKRLRPKEIAVILHEDIDETAARTLIEAQVSAIINGLQSITGRYPNPGPQFLCEAGIPIIDNVGKEITDKINDNQYLEIDGGKIFLNGNMIGEGRVLTEDMILTSMKEAKANLGPILDEFVTNTLEYAKREKGLILGEIPIPEISEDLYGRQVVVVVRGKNYKEDLSVITSYIEEEKPVLIGVDGGGDALMEFGFVPHIVIGDMDSVSDGTLMATKEIIVHAYPDGKAPGLERVKSLGLDCKLFPAPGTSEDIALLMAYEKGASLIVAVGTHSNIIDFLEKGRKGMASTFLVRLKVGSIMVDAKGVSLLYKGYIKGGHIAQVAFAALIPIIIILISSDVAHQFIRLLAIKLRIMLGF